MKSILKKSVVLVMSLIIVLSAFSFSTFAAGSTSISLSNNSLYVGSTLTVTVKITADEEMYSAEGFLQFDENILEYVSSSTAGVNLKGTNRVQMALTGGEVKSISATMTFKTKKIGQCSLKFYDASYVQAPDRGFGQITVSGSNATVNVADTSSQKSSNANLKTLYLSNNIPLTPAFNKDVTTYNVNIDNSITKVLVSAIAEDAGAGISVKGSADMKEGANQRIVVVTAPNGTQKKYVININRATADGTTLDINPYEVTINGEKWILANEYPEGTVLERFTLSSTMVNSLEVPAIVNEVNNKVVVMAKNADGSVTKYFEYTSATGEFKEYRMLKEASQNYVLLDLVPNTETPKGYYKTTAVLGGHSVEVFKYENPNYADYLIFYAEYNSEIKDYFRYDSTTGSVQRSPEFNVDLAEAKILENSKFSSRLAALTVKERIFVGAVFVSGLLVLALIIIMIVKIAKTASQNRLARIDELEELEELEEYDYYEPEQDDFELLEEAEEAEEE